MNLSVGRLRALRALALATLALVVVTASVSAQARGPVQGAGQGRGPGPGAGQDARGGVVPPFLRDSLPGAGPIGLLLDRRDSLGLSEAQVRALQDIAATLHQQNAPLIEALLESRRQLQPLLGMRPRDMAPAQRAHFARHAERARPVMQQVQRNNARAMNRVGQVLTAPQKRQLRLWLQQGEVPGARPGPP
jgi:hypothetical protein